MENHDFEGTNSESLFQIAFGPLSSDPVFQVHFYLSIIIWNSGELFVWRMDRYSAVGLDSASIQKYPAHSATILRLRFSPDGSYLLLTFHTFFFTHFRILEC